MAINIPQNQVLARPVESYYKGRALRLAERQGEQQLAIGEQQLAVGEQEKQLNQMKLDSFGQPEPPTIQDFNTFEDVVRKNTEDLYNTYTGLKETLGEEDALAVTNVVAQRFRDSMRETFPWSSKFIQDLPYSPAQGDALFGPESKKDPIREQKIADYMSSAEVIAQAEQRGVPVREVAVEIADGTNTVLNPDLAGRVFLYDRKTNTLSLDNTIIPAAASVLHQEIVQDLDSIMLDASELRDKYFAGTGETFGAENILQRGIRKVGRLATAPLGGWWDTSFLEERLGRDAVLRFNQRAKAAFRSADDGGRFAVWEQQQVQNLLLNPDSFDIGEESAQVQFLELMTFIENRKEQSQAYLEGRDPIRKERPRLGTEYDPLVFADGDPLTIARELQVGTWFINPETGRRAEAIR